MSDVFVSYKRENLAAVGRLVEARRDARSYSARSAAALGTLGTAVRSQPRGLHCLARSAGDARSSWPTFALKANAASRFPVGLSISSQVVNG